MRAERPILVLLLLASALSLAGLGAHDLWPPDEPRFAQVAREMMQTGDYLVPRVNGRPYQEKPPLLFWLMAAFSAGRGDVTELTARIPSALAGILTVLFTYLLARKMYGERIAFWAGVVLATTQRFWWQTHIAQIDMLLTACITGALLSLWLWESERRKRYLVLFYAAMAAGVFAKGPAAIIFPLLTIGAFYWKRKEDRRSLHLAVGLSAVLLCAAVWLIPARMAVSIETSASAPAAISANLFRQTIGRFFLGVSHANPPWYYLLQLPLDLLPWSLFLPWALPWVVKRRHEGPEMRFLLAWIVGAFLFFSICVGKRAVYLLPILPAVSILIARSVLGLAAENRERWLKAIGIVWGLTLILLSGAPLLVLATEHAAQWNNAFLAVTLGALACGGWILWGLARGESRKLVQRMAVTSCLLYLGIATAILPHLDSAKSAKAFCRPLRELSRAGVDYDLYSLGFSREEYIYYAEHFHQPLFTGLLPIRAIADWSQSSQARFQRRTMEAIGQAVDSVPIASIDAVTDEEMNGLSNAALAGLESAGAETGASLEFRAAACEVLDGLFSAAGGAAPTFFMVQERDWRWILALYPAARSLDVLENESVGSRRVLLVGNAPATAICRRMGAPGGPALATVSTHQPKKGGIS